MPTMVTVGGLSVDFDDPCAVCRAMQIVLLQRQANGAVQEVEVRSPVTNRRLNTALSPLSELQDAVAFWRRQCDGASGKVSRRARTIRFI